VPAGCCRPDPLRREGSDRCLRLRREAGRPAGLVSDIQLLHPYPLRWIRTVPCSIQLLDDPIDALMRHSEALLIHRRGCRVPIRSNRPPLGCPYCLCSQCVIATLRRVCLMVSSSRGFAEVECRGTRRLRRQVRDGSGAVEGAEGGSSQCGAELWNTRIRSRLVSRWVANSLMTLSVSRASSALSILACSA